jgi:hypothetical protein
MKAPDPHITLAPPTGATGNDGRVGLLTTLANLTLAKETHIDGLRQRNITIALAVFAGVFSFRLASQDVTTGFFASVALTALMVFFTVLDRRLHMFSHGWRHTRWEITDRLAQVINAPTGTADFFRYYPEAEKDAEWGALQPVIFYCLVVGGILSFFTSR